MANATGFVTLRTQYTGDVIANSAATAINDALDLTATIAYGTSPNQAIDRAWSHTNASLTTGGETWVMSALVAPSGTLVLAHVREITVINTGAQAITMGSASNPFVGAWSGTVTVPAGGIFTWVNPLGSGTAVVASTNDGIKLVSASATTSYTIVLKGTVA